MPTQKSIDYKETAVNYYLVEDKTQEEVCQIFNCSRRSLMRWVQKYKNEGASEETVCSLEIEHDLRCFHNPLNVENSLSQ